MAELMEMAENGGMAPLSMLNEHEAPFGSGSGEAINSLFDNTNMSLPEVCHTFNSSILETLNLTDKCSNRPALPPIFGTFVQVSLLVDWVCGQKRELYLIKVRK